MSHLLPRTLYLSFTLMAVFSLAACGGGRTAADGPERAPSANAPAGAAPTSHDVDAAAVDASVAPGDDFFRHANGSWIKKTEIPPDRSSYGVWSVLFDRAQQRNRELLEKAAAGTAAAGSEERKIGDYFATYMDEQTVEKKGLEPLRRTLTSIDGIADKRALASWIGEHLRADVDPLNMTNFHTDRLFGVWVAQNLNDPSHNVPYLLQGGLGLPDRDYYVQSGARMDDIRNAYRTHVANVLKLAGLDKPDERAAAIFDLERRIANTHATRTESVDVGKANNPWKQDEFGRRAPGLDWNDLLAGARLNTSPVIIVWHPAAFRGIAALVQSVPLDVWRDYLKFHELDRYSSVLPKGFADERFAFYGKTLSGTPQQQDRWKRAVNATNGALGEMVGKVYVARYFPATAKTQLQQMVASIVAAFDKRLDALTWMSPATKASAKAKLASLKVGIGYPTRGVTFRGYKLCAVTRSEMPSVPSCSTTSIASSSSANHRTGRVVARSADGERGEPADSKRAQFPSRHSGAAVLRSAGERGGALRCGRRHHRPRNQPQLRRSGKPVRCDRTALQLVDAGGSGALQSSVEEAGGAVQRLHAISRPARERTADAEREHR
jgi:predicted metalloendopeptidase